MVPVMGVSFACVPTALGLSFDLQSLLSFCGWVFSSISEAPIFEDAALRMLNAVVSPEIAGWE